MKTFLGQTKGICHHWTWTGTILRWKKFFKLKGNDIRQKWPILRVNDKDILIKTAEYWWKNRHIHQCNRIESSGIDPHKYSQLIFEKDANTIQWRKDKLHKYIRLSKLSKCTLKIFAFHCTYASLKEKNKVMNFNDLHIDRFRSEMHQCLQFTLKCIKNKMDWCMDRRMNRKVIKQISKMIMVKSKWQL